MGHPADNAPRHQTTRLALLGIPFDDNSSFLRGAAQAPPLIRQALFSDASNLWAESGVNLGLADTFFDAGDLSLTSPETAFAQIESAVADLLAQNRLPISFGGDHSITYPILKAFRKQYEKLGILHIDAHPDLYDELLGNRYSHASPFARILEDGLCDRLVQIGIRTMNGHQREQAARFGVEVYEMKDWCGSPALRFDMPVYLSIDLDGLDPACAPGVSHHEPGGLSTRDVLMMIHRLEATVIGADIVEFNPDRDVMQMTAMVCAKLVKEIAAKMLGG